MVIDALVVLQPTFDLPSFPSALIIEDISEVSKIALIELNTAVPTEGDVRIVRRSA